MTQVLDVITDALKLAGGEQKMQEPLANLAAGGDLNVADLDLDSLDRFEVIMKIEEAFEIELDDDEVQEQKTVRTLVDFVTTRVSGSAA